MSYYQNHVFICTNQRDNGRKCCADGGSKELLDYAKHRIKELKLSGPGKNRINMSGCLDRCALGPVLVVYPQEVWYHYETQADIDEIIEKHLIGGQIVERLQISVAN